MNLNDYQREAKKTLQSRDDNWPIELYLALKLQQEASEAQQDITKHVFHGAELDVPRLIRELGDTFWYIAVLADFYGWSLNDLALENISKLRARHGESYNPNHYRDKAHASASGVAVYDYEPEDEDVESLKQQDYDALVDTMDSLRNAQR